MAQDQLGLIPSARRIPPPAIAGPRLNPREELGDIGLRERTPVPRVVRMNGEHLRGGRSFSSNELRWDHDAIKTAEGLVVGSFAGTRYD